MSNNGDGIDIHSTGPGAVADAFANQVAYCIANDAPITARIVAGLWAALAGSTGGAIAERVLGWPGAPLADALPLRLAGALHALHLGELEPALAPIYADQPGVDDAAIIAQVLTQHRAFLLPWLDGPPQTNEAGRSVNFIAAMLWAVDKGFPGAFDCIEIGSSAGINLMIDRYHYRLGPVSVGPADSAMQISPEWRGPPPPNHPLRFAAIRGSDIAPVDLGDAGQALRLKAYIWPEHHARFQRMAAAIAMAQQCPPALVTMNAADQVEQAFAAPQTAGTVRVLMHSIMWQYMPPDQQERVVAAMTAAGARATMERPIVWIALEANRTVHQHELVVRIWPGDGAPRLIARSHAHGAWVEWLGAGS